MAPDGDRPVYRKPGNRVSYRREDVEAYERHALRRGTGERAIIGPLGAQMAAVHTLTADNGKEFAGHRLIESALKADFYFADAYSDLPVPQREGESARAQAQRVINAIVEDHGAPSARVP